VVLNVRNNFHTDIRIDVSRFHESLWLPRGNLTSPFLAVALSSLLANVNWSVQWSAVRSICILDSRISDVSA